MAVAIHFDRVCKSFGDLKVVDAISLSIQPGELFFLLGPSGCGKTTLLRSIAGFYIPESGRILFDDEDITNLPPEERDTGMVFQSYALWPHLSVAQNVAFGLELRKVPKDEAKKRVAEALAMVRMTDRADYKPNQLSGGQQQRVALARALVIKPKCLLLDEPLSNLDAKLRLEMRTEIRRICKQSGLTAVYVTHDQKEALSVADRIAVMDRGVIQQCGTPQDVYLRPRSRFVANFIGETNFIEGRVKAVHAGKTEVDTSIGVVTSTVEPVVALAPGDKVTISLRPEVIHVGTQTKEEANTFPAHAHDTIYLGEMAQHQISVGSGAGEVDLKAFELNPKTIAHDDERKPTHVWFRANHVVLLKD